MKVKVLVVILSVVFGFFRIYASASITKTVQHHVQAKNPDTTGFWNKKVTWKARWVKSWKSKKYYVPVWNKVWGPILINEWTPLPKPPPGWIPKQGF